MALPIDDMMATENEEAAEAPVSPYDPKKLLELADNFKKECFDSRWVFERQWQRNIYYVMGRQWIYFSSNEGDWRDKRLAKWIPRPVTNLCKSAVQAIRAMFSAIKLGVNTRPNGHDPEAITTASTADEIAPLLHEEHEMDLNQVEFDYWFEVTGNAFWHTFWDYDPKWGTIDVQTLGCVTCGKTYQENELEAINQTCPDCGGVEFAPVVDPLTQEPVVTKKPTGRGSTIALSPLELAFPNTYPRFADVPGVIRLRWREKRYYMDHPQLKEQFRTASFQKSPSERTMQLFKSLPTQNDLGASPYAWGAATDSGNEEGLPEYEFWFKPTNEYPDGLVFRVAGDSNPVVIELPEEGLPGPIPYHDVKGNPLFTFTHAQYEHVGGRILGSGLLDPLIQKQDQINQLDSMVQLTLQRTAHPHWSIPKGSEVDQFSAAPGWIMRWNPLTVGGNAEPKLLPGIGPDASMFTLREQYLQDFENLSGATDALKGLGASSGDAAFSALQLRVERSQARFANAFSARGNAYRDWFMFAIELEREFGKDERIKSILGPAKSWTFETFKRADLQGSITVVVEDGSNVPKTALGRRAAIEHAAQLKMLNPQDPDQQYAILTNFGLTDLVPSLDIHVQSALQKQQGFENWAADPAAMQQAAEAAMQEEQQFAMQTAAIPPDPTGLTPAPTPPSPLKHTPLKWLPWYSPAIHKQEFLKWANGDRVRELLREQPQLQGLLEAHLLEIDIANAEAMMGMVGGQSLAPPQANKGGPPQAKPAGAGAAANNSNRESTEGNEPSGSKESVQNQGPR